MGGVSTWNIDMARALIARGDRAVLIEHTNAGWHPRWPDDVAAGIPVEVCGGPDLTRFKPRHIKAMGRVYERALPAVFIPNLSSMAYGVCARLSLKESAAMRVLGMAHGDSEGCYSGLVYYEPLIHAFVAMNQKIAETLKEKIPHRRADIHTRSCPVEVPDEWTAPDRGTGPLRLCYAGRVTNHEKQVHRIVPLVRALAERQVDFRLRIIGDGGYLEGLKADCASLSSVTASRISFEGMREPGYVSQALMETDVVFLVSDTESTGLSLLEGMAVGCVPLSTRCGGPEEFIESGVNGYLVDRDQIDAAAPWLEQVWKEPERQRALSKAAYETVRDRYSRSEYLPWFIDLLAQVWAMPPRPWPKDKPLLAPAPASEKKPRISLMARMRRRRLETRD